MDSDEETQFLDTLPEETEPEPLPPPVKEKKTRKGNPLLAVHLEDIKEKAKTDRAEAKLLLQRKRAYDEDKRIEAEVQRRIEQRTPKTRQNPLRPATPPPRLPTPEPTYVNPFGYSNFM